MVADFDEWAASDAGDEATRPARYFKGVLLPAYTTAFQAIEGRGPKNEDTIKQLRPDTRPLYKALKDAYAQGKYSKEGMNTLAWALTEADKQIVPAAHFRQSAMGDVPADLLQYIATFLDIGSRVRFSRAGKHLRTNLLGAPAAISWHPVRRQMVSFTLQDIIDFMSEYEFGGLHGSTSKHKASMFKEIRLVSSSDRIYETGQLAEGFYMTEGSSKPAHRVYADSVATEAVKKHGGSKYFYRIFVGNLSGMKTKEVPKSDWADMEHNLVTRQLETDTASYDALRAPIVNSETSRQIKINPRAIRYVLALPATGPSGTITQDDFMNWLEQLMSAKRL